METNERRDWESPEYKAWRKAVRERDKKKCQMPGCQTTGTAAKRLQTHHIRRWSSFPELRYDVNNGITLCVHHHDLVKRNEEMFEPIFTAIATGSVDFRIQLIVERWLRKNDTQ